MTDRLLRVIAQLLSVEVFIGLVHCLLTAAAVFGWVQASGGH